MSRFRNFSAVAGLALAIAIGVLHVNKITPVEAAALSVVAPIPVADVLPCELICLDGPSYCESEQHDAFLMEGLEELYDSLIQGGSHNGQMCWSGDCVTMHSKGECEPIVTNEEPLSVADLESLRQAIADGDRRALRALVTSFPSQLKHNVGRNAIQVVTCGGVVAHLPVPAALMADHSALGDSF